MDENPVREREVARDEKVSARKIRVLWISLVGWCVALLNAPRFVSELPTGAFAVGTVIYLAVIACLVLALRNAYCERTPPES